MTQAPPSPPNRLRPKRNGSDAPKCGVCAKRLGIEDVHGRDCQLGPICRECGPHLVNAIVALMRK